MKFAELYKNNILAVEKALDALWCAESVNDSQRSHVRQLKGIVRDLFAPDLAYPVVQCMNSYEPVTSVSVDEAVSIVGSLWRKSWKPYEHQYRCWNTLLNKTDNKGKPMSICVTTGTGSGKTECFMLPLVYDLINHNNIFSNEIQALFLYPLNALMEDQKERLEEILTGTDLKFAVYNGDLPESEPSPSSNSANAVSLRHNIEQLTGGEYKLEGSEWVLKDNKYPHMLYTRSQVRATPPNILLTNPTMLEYILLRRKDSTLINPDKHSLRWVVIDETHSYTGAGAAELAMLLRRVLLAFDCNASDIRFATSSATFGNGTDDIGRLQEFISSITGVDREQVEVVGGKRVGEDKIIDSVDSDRWKLLFEKDFVSIDELFPNNETIFEKLSMLDEMCEREDARCNEAGLSVPDMKAKVHYYYRVPNNGLYVRLNNLNNDGSFKIYTDNVIDNEESDVPLLELSRCKHCGEFVAVGRVSLRDGSILPLESDDSDMFDLVDDGNESSEYRYAFFSLSNTLVERGDNNVMCTVSHDGKIESCLPGQFKEGDWHIVVNTQYCCPYCGVKQADKGDLEGDDSYDNFRLRKFRISPDFVSRIIAPSVLDQLDKGESEEGKLTLHDGQQYISFVDSRQAAAQNTLKQNIEQERLWFYNVVFKGLCKRKTEQADIQNMIDNISEDMKNYDDDSDEFDNLYMKRRRLKRKLSNHMSWMEVAKLIYNDKYCDVFCDLFVKHSRDSEELDEDGNITPEVKEQYVQSLMVMYLANKISSSASNETMGLFHPCYPQLDNIKYPKSVETFNGLLKHAENKISNQDWRNLLQIFMDYTVRSNQSFFLKIDDDNKIDIFSSVRFATMKPIRRPTMKPKFEKGRLSRARIVRYLCALIVRDDSSISMNDAQKLYFDYISDIIDDLWDVITDEKNGLIENSLKWDKEKHKHVFEKEYAPRLNLVNMSFKLYEDVYLCDTNTSKGGKHTKRMRPIENNFKGFSPYLNGGNPIMLDPKFHEIWEPFAYHSEGEEMSPEYLHEWAKNNRTLLWDNGLWSDDGIFANYLDQIYLYPDLYLQAEHTAQVDKAVARGFQKDFKDHTINILACSTTMEMGVDLGNLEVVMLSSVPPMPANYKQRAGRSGRNNKVKSACITLCGSNAIGLRTLYNPIEKIISRPVKVPTVDLRSPQVVQRHVNSFLIRYFGVFSEGTKGGNLNQKVVDFYTPFIIKHGRDGHLYVLDEENNEIGPGGELGVEVGTMYDVFNKKCCETISEKLKQLLGRLLKSTVFEGCVNQVVKNARKENSQRYSELYLKAGELSYANSQEGISEKYRTKLKMQYLELLNQKLINFWATNRFTPNANMPVNVLTLDINSSNRSFYSASTSSNPSYSLRQAIAQYAPGNCIAVDGVVYTVRGVGYAKRNGSSTFKTIYRNADKTVINDDHIPKAIPWQVNDKIGVELVQPESFLPDMNESRSRILEPNEYTRVSAQLIDTDKWVNIVTEPHLFSVRSNRETGTAKILYYNEGKGFGYCFCTRCGRMVMENEVADELDPGRLPSDFNPCHPKKKDDGTERPKYHLAISGRDYRKACNGSNNYDAIRRNVIIGDLIQTDFCEIRIRHRGDKKWMSNRSEEEKLLFTLGIVFTQVLVDILGKERGAVDFTIMPNGHLCIFDTNPGGAGYSNQLSDILLMKEVILSSEVMLNEAKKKRSKDFLLDKYTLRYMKYIDINAALDWIKEEKFSTLKLPEDILNVFPDASETSLHHLIRKSELSHEEITLFADNVFFDSNVEGWNYLDYNEGENGWMSQYFGVFSSQADRIKFCMTKSSKDNINEPIRDMLRSLSAWCMRGVVEIDNPYKNSSLYPIAYVDGALYFTNNREIVSLNNKWGNGTLYAVNCNNPADSAVPVDLDYRQNTEAFMLDSCDSTHIKSDELAGLLYNNAKNIIDDFIEDVKRENSDLSIIYQDQHLKSVLGIVITLQTIGFFVKKIGKDFSLRFLVEKYDNRIFHQSITSNLFDDSERDAVLDKLSRGYISNLKSEINGELLPVESLERKTLAHWRVLTFKCGNKKLEIYPDGGFANGWFLDTGKCEKYYDYDNTDAMCSIPIKREQVLKFEVNRNDD